VGNVAAGSGSAVITAVANDWFKKKET